jgi:hypothetical protein
MIARLKEWAASVTDVWREHVRVRYEARARATTGDRPVRTICIRATVVVPLPLRKRSSTRVVEQVHPPT